MKHLLLLLLILPMLFSCSKDNTTDEDEVFDERLSIYSNDSTFSIGLFKSSNDLFYLKKHINGNLVKETEIETPLINVDYGYGDAKDVDFYPKSIYIFSNSILLLYRQGEFYSFLGDCIYISIFDHELNIKNKLLINKSKRYDNFELWKWGENQFIIYATSYNANDPRYFIRYNQHGELIMSETESYMVSGSVTDPLGDYDYINVNSENAYRSSLKGFGYDYISWEVKYSEYINNKDICSGNPPIAKMKNYKINDGIFDINLSIVYCDGTMSEANLKFDILNGQIIGN